MFAQSDAANYVTVVSQPADAAIIFQVGTCAGSSRFGSLIREYRIAPANISASLPLAPGVYCFRSAVENTDGVRGAWGQTRQRTVAQTVAEVVTP